MCGLVLWCGLAAWDAAGLGRVAQSAGQPESRENAFNTNCAESQASIEDVSWVKLNKFFTSG